MGSPDAGPDPVDLAGDVLVDNAEQASEFGLFRCGQARSHLSFRLASENCNDARRILDGRREPAHSRFGTR